MSKHWNFENQRLFGYTVTKVKTIVFKLQFSTLLNKVSSILAFFRTKLPESIVDM